MGTSGIDPSISQLIDAARERTYRISAPLPSSIEMEDTEVIRAYVDREIRRAIEEWFDSSLMITLNDESQC